MFLRKRPESSFLAYHKLLLSICGKGRYYLKHSCQENGQIPLGQCCVALSHGTVEEFLVLVKKLLFKVCYFFLSYISEAPFPYLQVCILRERCIWNPNPFLFCLCYLFTRTFSAISSAQRLFFLKPSNL